jgi:hypothetical protein
MRRVVRPGGRVLLLEHNRSPNALLGLYQVGEWECQPNTHPPPPLGVVVA